MKGEPKQGISKHHAPGSFRFRITHDLVDPSGLFLLFQLTRPLVSPRRRRAKDNAFIRAATSDADSFLPLGISGTVYDIVHPSVEVPTGAPYAVRVRMISTDGLPGGPTTAYRMRV